MTKVEDIRQFGSLAITKDGEVFNIVKNRFITISVDNNGYSSFYSPDTESNFRLSYVMAMLFLNNGEFIKDVKDYYIEFKDGDKNNNKLENLRLIVGREAVRKKRGTILEKARSQRQYHYVIIHNLDNFDMKYYTIAEAAKFIDCSETKVRRMASQCTFFKKNCSRYVIADNELDAWEFEL